jgi:uncharacterized protein (DUF2141 family)
MKLSWEGKMNSKKTAHLMRSCSALAIVLSAVAVVTAGSLTLTSPAAAQDYTSGAITGDVVDGSGAPVANATITVSSEAQGFTRTVTSSSNGKFRFVGLPPGSYAVSVSSAAGNMEETSVSVSASSTSNYTLVVGEEMAAEGLDMDALETIAITGLRVNQDFSNTSTGINIDVSDLVSSVPMGRSITDVALLAPTATSGDDTFGNLASLGGASVAENAYYINGLNITNFDKYLGSTPVPFEFYRSVEVKTGGYSAEFGRATGGIINAVSKSGTNEWKGALHLNWEPDGLASNAPDTYVDRNSLDERSEFSTILELGGPIVKDRLFVYGLVEFQDDKASNAGILSGAYEVDTENDPIWAAKVDAYPLDNHHLEFTIFDTSTSRNRISYDFDSSTDTIGDQVGATEFKSGGLSYIGKYTGWLTDWMTVSGAYGVTKDTFEALPENNGNMVVDNTLAGGGAIISDQTLGGIDMPYDIKREFYRADVDFYFDLFGSHHIRTGFDHETNTLSRVYVNTGGDNIGDGVAFAPGGVFYSLYECGASTSQCLASGLSAGDTYVGVAFNNAGGIFQARNTAFYVQDEWQITSQLTLNLGLRMDKFGNYAADGTQWIDFDGEWAPRIGFSYDVFDDGRVKFFGNYGKYYLPVASNTSYSTFGTGLSFEEYWETDGTFGSGNVPTLTNQIVGFGGAACPFPIFGGGGQNCTVIADGSVPGPEATTSQNLKATEQDEYILGLSYSLDDLWTLGVTYTRRRLLEIAEDSAIDAGVRAYCAAEGIEGCDDIWGGFHQYVIVNPNSDVIVTLNDLINGESTPRTVTLLAEDLGYPDAVRKYDAIEFTFDRAFDGIWSLRGSYTWSRSRGNSEGYVQSDYGQDIAGITVDFDQPGFTEGAYGLLPNHREHQFKMWGSYQVTKDFLVGGFASLTSPRKFGCIGNHGGGFNGSNLAYWYGAYAHYCLGNLQPRGTGLDGAGLESSWIKRVDISLRYNIDLPFSSEATLRADVFNIFNFDGVTDVNEIGEADFNSDSIVPQYGLPIGYQRPRYARLGLDINF